MDADTPLSKAHDLSQQLQDRLETLPRVERAFVHVDHETSHTPVREILLDCSRWESYLLDCCRSIESLYDVFCIKCIVLLCQGIYWFFLRGNRATTVFGTFRMKDSLKAFHGNAHSEIPACQVLSYHVSQSGSSMSSSKESGPRSSSSTKANGAQEAWVIPSRYIFRWSQLEKTISRRNPPKMECGLPEEELVWLMTQA
jgi:hypothetical protein